MLTATPSPPTLERLDDPQALERLETEWKALQQAGGARTFFQTWEWNALWWQHFGRGTLRIVTVRRDGELIGVAPLFLARGLGKPIRFVGTGSSDYLDVIAQPQDYDQVCRLIGGELLAEQDAGLLDLHQLREGSPLTIGYEENEAPQATTFRLRLPTDWDEYAVRLNAKMRSNIKRAYRDAEAEGRFRVRTILDGETEVAMDAFFRLHARRWRRRGLPGSFAGGAVRRFHSEWAELAAGNNWLRLSVLEFGEDIRATLYGFRYADTYYFYQAGFDPQISRLSPGTILVAHAIRSAIEEGCGSFDFLRGEETYKARWKPQEIGRNVRLLVPLAGWSGKAGSAWCRKLQGVESLLRARFEGGSLLRKPK